ncbi:MAG: hypothetical protein MUF87_12905 [Anaerolineae bacterium]|jgi:hypothetical protein|nr:hypothetical protein [Anaerolineae bacterium]
MNLLIIADVNVTHFRLIDLTRLADQAKPFYEWVEKQFQIALSSDQALEVILLTAQPDEIKQSIRSCYLVKGKLDIPFLFDGIGRTYPHSKACYYFFSWLIRDAPQQRLAPLIQRIVKSSSQSRLDSEIEVLTALIVEYRDYVKTFSWEVIREIIIDRLEGSRRSIKGHEKETVVRTALIIAIQEYFHKTKSYGIYAGVEIPDTQVMIGNESYDISVNLLDTDGNTVKRILIPIKTRETEGGGHSHLFTRDILSAINAVKESDYVVVVIVAKNWAQRETESLNIITDHLALFDMSPGEFTLYESEAQIRLNTFIANVFDGIVIPKGKS